MLRDEMEKVKRDGLIGTVIQQGACRFCGQFKKVETLNGWTEEACDELATETCTCMEATTYARKKGQKERADKLIEKQFVECKDNPALPSCVIDILHNAVVIASEDKIKSLTIDNGEGTKAKISITSKGNIKVERTDTDKECGEA